MSPLGKDSCRYSLVTDNSAVNALLVYFEEHFQGGRSRRITEDWLNEYRALWKQRNRCMNALRGVRNRIRRIRLQPTGGKQPPKRIKGHTFCFTGKIEDWPRETFLHPEVERLGGKVAKKANSMGMADCLVHGDILGKKQSTQKLLFARRAGIPVISEEEFMDILGREDKARSAKARS